MIAVVIGLLWVIKGVVLFEDPVDSDINFLIRINDNCIFFGEEVVPFKYEGKLYLMYTLSCF